MNTTVRKQSSSERPCEARLCVQHSTSAPAFHSAQSHKKIIKMPPRRQQLHHVEWLITGRSKSHFVWRNARMLMNNNDDVDLPLGKQLEPANGSEKRFLFIYADSKFGWAEDVHFSLESWVSSIFYLHIDEVNWDVLTGTVWGFFFAMQLLVFCVAIAVERVAKFSYNFRLFSSEVFEAKKWICSNANLKCIKAIAESQNFSNFKILLKTTRDPPALHQHQPSFLLQVLQRKREQKKKL